MGTRVGINGFGRVGRQVLKAILEYHSKELEVVAINDLFDAKTNAHLFKYDSNYGIFAGTVEVDGGDLLVDGKRIKVFAEKDPRKLSWKDLGVKIVVESTGIFTEPRPRARKAGADVHIEIGGAKKVIITAPAKDEDMTMVLGVNDDKYDPAKHHIVSNASCTTNCLAPAAKVVHDTVRHRARPDDHRPRLHQRPAHPRSGAQGPAPGARGRGLNIIPTTTGAAQGAGQWSSPTSRASSTASPCASPPRPSRSWTSWPRSRRPRPWKRSTRPSRRPPRPDEGHPGLHR